mmetsp:Transcript_3821/g.8229  ORF Transcript_3821/g.8229 Transcript_3821/m.8229 type:complete len:200 (+) Transcript_3821:885-1484(+)
MRVQEVKFALGLWIEFSKCLNFSFDLQVYNVLHTPQLKIISGDAEIPFLNCGLRLMNFKYYAIVVGHNSTEHCGLQVKYKQTGCDFTLSTHGRCHTRPMLRWRHPLLSSVPSSTGELPGKNKWGCPFCISWASPLGAEDRRWSVRIASLFFPCNAVFAQWVGVTSKSPNSLPRRESARCSPTRGERRHRIEQNYAERPG